MSDKRKITTDDVMRLRPCSDWPIERVHHHLGDGGLTLDEFVNLRIDISNILWVLFNSIEDGECIMVAAATLERLDQKYSETVKLARLSVIDGDYSHIPHSNNRLSRLVSMAVDARAAGEEPTVSTCWSLDVVEDAILLNNLTAADVKKITDDAIRFIQEVDSNE